MRVVRLIRPASLAVKSFRCWTKSFVEYLEHLPGRILHLVFDDYKFRYSIQSKNGGSNNLEREINDLDQELPKAIE